MACKQSEVQAVQGLRMQDTNSIGSCEVDGDFQLFLFTKVVGKVCRIFKTQRVSASSILIGIMNGMALSDHSIASFNGLHYYGFGILGLRIANSFSIFLLVVRSHLGLLQYTGHAAGSQCLHAKCFATSGIFLNPHLITHTRIYVVHFKLLIFKNIAPFHRNFGFEWIYQSMSILARYTLSAFSFNLESI
jgi:hypothetical protein